VQRYDVVVVGAGIHGLSAALALRARGLAATVVLERFALDHARGSSHGASRILRASYHDPLYVRLARAARHDGWPALARALGVEPLLPTPGLFFGPDSSRLRAYFAATLGSGARVEAIDAAAARARYPLLAVPGDSLVLLDHDAGILTAATVLAAMRRWLAANGVELRAGVRATAVHGDGAGVVVETEAGELRAHRAVLACGPWTSALVPDLAPRCTVLRQWIGYYALDAPAAACAPPCFPVWARIGAEANDFTYGLPAVGEAGVKLACHRTRGAPDDPDADASESEAALAALDRVAGAVFRASPRRVRSETCLYTMTADEHFVVDALPHDRRIVVVSACSGHGFKFAPVLAELVADLLLAGVRPPAAFAWPAD